MTLQNVTAATPEQSRALAAPLAALDTASTMGAFLDRAQEFYQLATTIASASVVPDTFRNRPANVFMALEIASRLKLGVFEVMQSMYPAPGGKLGFLSTYVIGLANQRGPFRGPITYDESGSGEDLSVTAKATILETGECVSFTASMAMARAEGWARNGKTTKSGKPVGNPKYDTMPGLMLRYRAGTLLVRTTCPEVLLGMPTVEELVDVRASTHGMGALAPATEGGAPDPLDAILADVDVLDTAVEVAVPATAAVEYAPSRDVDKIAARLKELGVSREEFAASFGPLDQMTPRTFQEAIEYGKEKAREAEALHEETEPPAPERESPGVLTDQDESTNALFSSDADTSGYGDDA